MLKDEMNGRDRAARLEEWSHSGAGIRDDPPNDPGWMSHDYIPQIGPRIACNQEVAEKIGIQTLPSARGVQRQRDYHDTQNVIIILKIQKTISLVLHSA